MTMTDPVTLTVRDIIGHETCVDPDDGDKLYQQIEPILNDGGNVRLSFAGVGLLNTSFLNTAYGRLFGVYDEDQIRESVTVDDTDQSTQWMMEAVADNAKKFYA